MAEVFRAHEPRAAGAPRSVVIKRMLPALASEPAARAMFQEEARLGSLVSHPNVVEVLGSGEHDGLPFLVLEHVPGLDLWRLGRWLAREGRVLGVALATHIARELLGALHAVHESVDETGRPLGLVHRDVSPSNVLLSVHGAVKLGDFGIARALLSASFPHAAMSARAKGKLGYLSPEQVSGLPTDRRADVFAAAVVTAELLTGRPLFAGGSELAILLAIRDGDTHVLDQAASTLPGPIVRALRMGLARDPDARAPSALALAQLLEAAEREAGVASSPDDPRLRMELAGIVAEATHRRAPSGLLPAVGGASTPWAEAAAPTGEAPQLEYRVRTSNGGSLGPWSYARLVEAVATHELGAEDQVAVANEPFRPLRDLPELFRHLPASSLSERTARYAEPTPPDAHYEIADGGVARALAVALLQRETGLLLFEQGSVRKEVYVVEGVPEFVSSNLASELLGEFLVARGVISRGELDMALAVMPRFEGKLGETLTALGLVEPVHLFRQIASQVREKLLDLFTWTSGRGSFFRGVSPPASGFPLGLDAFRLVEEGVDRRIAAGLEPDPRGALFRARRPAPRGLSTVPLGSLDRAILDHATRPTSFASLEALAVAGSSCDPRRLRREVALLEAFGALVRVPPRS
ncbi:MAG: hypothetical protein OHK0013_06600 [Sandaracinaceae bacterium]